MATTLLSDRDLRTRKFVAQQLDWDPAVDASAIGVAARDGAVTLTGYVNSYAEKLAAERAAKRVHGVRAVANDIEVRLKLAGTDADIAGDVATALRIHSSIPASVQAAVHHGHVTLTGTVSWLYQKTLAETIAGHVDGVRHVINHIVVLPRAGERDLQKRIVQALHRAADLEARRIDVQVSDGVARLSGQVHTWAERDAAAAAAAAAPGITMVDNQLVIEPQTRALDDVPDEYC
jgi:osmotically-inducible protein OsmY